MDKRKKFKKDLAIEFFTNKDLTKDGEVVTDVLCVAKLIAEKILLDTNPKTIFEVYALLRSQETTRLIMEAYKKNKKIIRDMPSSNSLTN